MINSYAIIFRFIVMQSIKGIGILLILFFISSSLNAQTKKLKRVLIIRSAPSFTLQLNFNYNQAMGQLAGAYNDDFRSDQFINGRSLGGDKGFGGSLITKIALPNKHIRINFSASYNRIQSYLFNKTGVADLGESKFNIYSFGMGLENNFTPNHRIKLYAGGEGLFSMINGDALIWVGNRPYTPFTYNVKIENSYRIGLGVTAGAEYMFSDNFGLNLGFKFTHANLLLKEGNETGDSTSINLVDDQSVPPSAYSGKKQFVYLSLQAGINVYLGINEKRYVLSR